MKFSTIIALALAGAASAQFTAVASAPATGTVICDALYIVNECLSLETAERNKCPVQDYECLCDTSARQDRCWDNCPKNTAERSRFSSDKTQWCSAWSQSPEFKTASASRSSYYATATTTSSSSMTSSSTASATSASKASETDSAKSGSAPGMMAVNNGAAFVVAAVVAAFL